LKSKLVDLNDFIFNNNEITNNFEKVSKFVNLGNEFPSAVSGMYVLDLYVFVINLLNIFPLVMVDATLRFVILQFCLVTP